MSLRSLPGQPRAQRRARRPLRPLVRALGVLVSIALSLGNLGCVVLRRPLALPAQDTPYVAVLSGEMPEPITIVSRHAWIIANPAKGKEPLLRYELMGDAFKTTTDQPFEYFGEGDVALHGLFAGDRAETARIIACLDVETPRYNDEHPTYFPMPGPNSNTYVDQMLQRCQIHVELPATAIGKDYRGVLGASVTSGGTGIQFESWLGGVKVGITEGIELHMLGLSIGVDFWPPALIVPVNPGRIGFDDR
jgi:hypothetical protein